MSEFMDQFMRNGETGVPQAFRRMDGELTTQEDYDRLVETLETEQVPVFMGTYSVSQKRGREALVKTAAGIPAEVLALIGQRTHLGEVALGEFLH